jgi:hypothetical protein
MSLPGLIDLIHELEQVFDRLSIDRSYGGAIACNYYAPPRFTQDVDVLILAPATRMPGLVEELSSIGCTETYHPGAPPVKLQRILSELRAKPYWTVLYCHGIRIEFFAPWHSFHHRVLERSPSRQLEGRAIRIHSAEDLIIFKKIFDRPKDIIDIKAMLLAQKGRLNLERLRSDAKTLLTDGSLDELNRLISDFG